jgi:hypothetical protein
MIIRVTSIFLADREKVFERLQEIETLRYICSPLAIFTPLEESQKWQAGAVFRFDLTACGIKFGVHTIKVKKFDIDKILTHEHNKNVPVWNHIITLEKHGKNQTKYTDIVEVRAGLKWLSEVINIRKYAILQEPVQIYNNGDLIQKVMLYSAKNDGTYIFLYTSTDEYALCSADYYYYNLELAEEAALDTYGIKDEDWVLIEDPLPYCQHDCIHPVRVKGRVDGNPIWGKFELFNGVEWLDFIPN